MAIKNVKTYYLSASYSTHSPSSSTPNILPENKSKSESDVLDKIDNILENVETSVVGFFKKVGKGLNDFFNENSSPTADSSPNTGNSFAYNHNNYNNGSYG